jgi:hypothetical protein
VQLHDGLAVRQARNATSSLPAQVGLSVCGTCLTGGWLAWRCSLGTQWLLVGLGLWRLETTGDRDNRLCDGLRADRRLGARQMRAEKANPSVVVNRCAESVVTRSRRTQCAASVVFCLCLCLCMCLSESVIGTDATVGHGGPSGPVWPHPHDSRASARQAPSVVVQWR